MVDYLYGLDPTLVPASYAGVPFFIDTDTEDYARRIVTHEYPMNDKPFHEDLGERYREFTIKGYLAGASATAQKEALKAAVVSRGASTLQMPACAPISAVCLSASITRSKDKQGYFDISLKFRQDFGVSGSPISATIFEQQIATTALAAVSAITSVFDGSFNCYGVLPYVISAQVGIIQAFADQVVSAIEETPTIGSSAQVAKAVQLALGLYQNAYRYVQPLGYSTFQGNGQINASNVFGPLTGALTADIDSNYTALTGTLQPTDPTLVNPYASAIVGVMGDLFDKLSGIFAPDDAVEVMSSFVSFSVGEQAQAASTLVLDNSTSLGLTVSQAPAGTLANVIAYLLDGGAALSPSLLPAPSAAANQTTAASLVAGPSDQANLSNAATINNTIRSLALMQYARAVTAADYTSRAQAVQARADVVELFNAQLLLVSDDEVSTALITCRDLAVKCLSTGIASLTRVVEVEASSSMPSLYWAGRLYDDAARAGELIDRNDVAMPAFMPTVFEALAS